MGWLGFSRLALLFQGEHCTDRTQQQLTPPRTCIQSLDYLNQENFEFAQKFKEVPDPRTLVRWVKSCGTFPPSRSTESILYSSFVGDEWKHNKAHASWHVVFRTLPFTCALRVSKCNSNGVFKHGVYRSILSSQENLSKHDVTASGMRTSSTFPMHILL